jgi:hypothetical protein
VIQLTHTLRRNHYHNCYHNKITKFHQEDTSFLLRWFTHPHSFYRDLLQTLLLLNGGGWIYSIILQTCDDMDCKNRYFVTFLSCCQQNTETILHWNRPVSLPLITDWLPQYISHPNQRWITSVADNALTIIIRTIKIGTSWMHQYSAHRRFNLQ